MFTLSWSRATILFLHLFVFALLTPDAHEKLQDEHKELRIKYFQLKQEADDLRDKMRFFTKVRLFVLYSSLQGTCLYPLFFRAAHISLSSVLLCGVHVFILCSSVQRTCLNPLFFRAANMSLSSVLPCSKHVLILCSSLQQTCLNPLFFPAANISLSIFLPCCEHVLNLHQSMTIYRLFSLQRTCF